MRLLKNIIANIAGKAWTFVSIYLFIPFYINILGVEAYAIISFYATLQTFLTLADVGLTATLNREFAKATSTDFYRANLLRTFENLYLFLAILISCITIIFAPQITARFLKSEIIQFEDIVFYVRLMGVTIGCNIFVYLYQGGMLGLQKQVAMNVLAIVFNAVKAGLVIIPLWFWRDLSVCFYWQLGCTILFCWIYRTRLNTYVSLAHAKSDLRYLKPLWRYTVGMMLMAVIYAANTQVDKLTVGALLSLTDFAYYFLGTTVGHGVLMLAIPMGTAFLPELTRLFSIPDIVSAKHLYHRSAFLITTVSSAVAVVLLFYMQSYIAIWQQNTEIAQIITPLSRLLVVSFLFLSIQLVPYYAALANGHTKTNVLMGIITIALLWPGIYVSIHKFGLVGAGLPQLVLNGLVTFVLGGIIIRKFLKGEFLKWLLRDTLVPIVVSVCIAYLLYLLFSCYEQGYWTLLYGVVMGGAIIGINGVIFCRWYSKISLRKILTRYKVSK